MSDKPKPEPQPRMEGKVPWCRDNCSYMGREDQNTRTCLLDHKRVALIPPERRSLCIVLEDLRANGHNKIAELKRQLAEAKELLSRTNCPECLANAKAEGRREGLEEAAKAVHAVPFGKEGLTRGDFIQAIRRLAGQDQDEGDCDHDWVDVRGDIVTSGEMCTKCHAVRAGNQGQDEQGGEEEKQHPNDTTRDQDGDEYDERDGLMDDTWVDDPEQGAR